MEIEVMETTVPKGRTLRIRNGADFQIKVVTGCLWVTQEHDTRDHVLDAGESFRVSRDGMTLAHAFKEVRLRIAFPVEAGAPSLTLGGGYREFGRSVGRAMLAEWLEEIRGWVVAGARVGRKGFTFTTTFPRGSDS